MKCPYCAEEVKDEAIVCRYCHRELTGMRLSALENNVNKRLEEFETHIHGLSKQIASLEAMMGSWSASDLKPTRSGSRYWLVYLVTTFVVSLAGIGSIYSYLVTGSPFMILLPLFMWMGIGIWSGASDPQHSIKRYGILALGVSFLSYFGTVAVILNYKYGWGAGQAINVALFYFPNWGLVAVLLFVTPFFLIILGGFLGEWLESKRPTGRKLKYPRELAEQLVRLSSQKGKSSVDMENLVKVIAALAPLIAAIGGILVPIVTILLAR